jgi:hypothetical protein
MRTNFIETQTNHGFLTQQREVVCTDSRISSACASHDTAVIMLICAIFGWAIGMVQMIFLGAWQLFHWELMPLLPFASAFGWSMIGMIVGGSGLFSKPPLSKKEPEHPAIHPERIAA